MGCLEFQSLCCRASQHIAALRQGKSSKHAGALLLVAERLAPFLQTRDSSRLDLMDSLLLSLPDYCEWPVSCQRRWGSLICQLEELAKYWPQPDQPAPWTDEELAALINFLYSLPGSVLFQALTEPASTG